MLLCYILEKNMLNIKMELGRYTRPEANPLVSQKLV
jgi:hypothetical protein